MEAVRELIKLGADVSARAHDGCRPLHFVGLKHSEAGYSIARMKNLADMLLDKGAWIDAANNAGATAIDVAADRGNQFIFDHLLKRGAIARRPLDLAAASP
jgi:ankyrin repeat protein